MYSFCIHHLGLPSNSPIIHSFTTCMKQLTVTWIRDVFAIGLGEFLVYVYLWARCKKNSKLWATLSEFREDESSD